MNEQGIGRLKHGEKESFLHYVSYKEGKYMLTLNDSSKISHIKENKPLEFNYEMKGGEYVPVELEIITEESFIKEVFDYMLEMNFTHFKTYSPNIVVLKFK